MTLPRADVLPEELRALPQWVAWNLEDIEGRPQPGKVPYTVGRKASTMAAADWLTFEAACALATEKNYSGVGFVFTKDDPYVGVDLDHVLTEGARSDLANEVCDLLTPGVYIETSQSGTGIHLIMKGKLPDGKRRKDAVECYEQGRYFAITGNVWEDSALALSDRTTQLQFFHTKFLGGPIAPVAPVTGDISAAELQADNDLIARIRASRSAREFFSLYDAFDPHEFKGDRSKADFNLAVILASYTMDEEQIIRIMANSALMRKKWEEKRGPISLLRHTVRSVRQQVGTLASAQMQGPPVFRPLSELAKDPHAMDLPNPVLRGIAWAGRVSMLAAREKMGKSSLVSAGAAALSAGTSFLGLPTPGPATVAWVSADREAAADILRRAKAAGADFARTHVLYPMRAADVMEALTAFEQPPKLVVVDTLWSLVAADVEDPHGSSRWPQAFAPFIAYARDHDAAVVLLHHATKGGNGGYRDSTAIGAMADMILEMRPVQGEITTRNIKAIGRFAAEDFSIDLQNGKYEYHAPARPKEERQAEMDGAVLGWLRGHPDAMMKDIEASCTGRGTEIRDTVKRLVQSGEVEMAKVGNTAHYTARASF